MNSVRFEGFDVLSNATRLMVSAEPITQKAEYALSQAENNESRLDDAAREFPERVECSHALPYDRILRHTRLV